MVALASFLKSMHVCIELVTREPGSAVHALQLFVARIPAPVHARNAQRAHGFQPAGIWHMRPAAQVDKVAGAVDADRCHVVRKAVDDVDLEILVDGGELSTA